MEKAKVYFTDMRTGYGGLSLPQKLAKLIKTAGIGNIDFNKKFAAIKIHFGEPGNGAADDKGIYYFVPKMVRYYLGEEPVLHNAPTYLPFYKEDLDYTLANLNKLVVKDVAEAGGYGVVFGRELTQEKLTELAGMIKREPRRFIAQEVIDFKDLPVMENGVQAERKADLRAFVLTGAETKVWPSGLTRFSREPDSFVVNSSQGGGFKDTWVLSD